jgi:7,8-dihydroneopterin aldolase/epimerase/oxygenase
MDRIVICDLAVSYRIGVTEEERANPQRLLLTIKIEHDLSGAAKSDDLADTIDYHSVSQELLRLGMGRSWNLIESVAVEIASLIKADFNATKVTVEVKKFVIPEAQFVSVRVTR